MIHSAKDALWEGYREDLSRLKLEKKARCSFSTCSQELADLDDIVDVLDDDTCLPEIICLAQDLQMPQLLLLHGTEQVGTEEICRFCEIVCSWLDNVDRQLKQAPGASAPQPINLPSPSVRQPRRTLLIHLCIAVIEVCLVLVEGCP